ncbi:MAG TPA: choice-of-anchor tandem repeat GloVer-containing protein [Rhizomicrobium sp.]|jgi:uncharacterized repeat protein (TIGR03803 family)
MRGVAVCMLAAVSVLAASLPGSVQAKPFKVLHVFLDGADGATSNAPLITDTSGNFFGTALQGGTSNDGVVFELTANGAESILYLSQAGKTGEGRKRGCSRMRPAIYTVQPVRAAQPIRASYSKWRRMARKPFSIVSPGEVMVECRSLA